MITHDTWQRIKEIFQSAQELPPEERSDFLDRACGDDKSLREEVEALLTAHASNEDFLNEPAYEFAAEILAGEETEFSAGQKIGRYTILSPLGSGGMGQIYLAEDAKLRRKIAIKLISPQFASDESRVQRFEQEALAVSALNHPNICVIHELGTTESGRHFIAMEFIQGTTLRQQLSRGPLSVSKALNIAVQVATALSSAHASRIVHRDIKPENIMLRPDGYVKVLDFGLAKLTEILPGRERADAVTETGMMLGTVKYMSPEQLRDTKVDERTDIWSLGVVLYEMLTGSTPFEARTSNETVAAVLAPQRSPLKFPDGIPRQLQDIITNALEKERDHRYQTVAKFATDVNKLRAKLKGVAESEFYSYLVRGDEQQTRKIERSGLFTRLKTQVVYKTEFLLSEIRSHKRAALFTSVTGVLVLLLFLPRGARYVSSWINPPTEQIETLLVTNAGTSVCSAISPDRKWAAHAEEKAGMQRLVLTNIATAASSEIVAPSEVQYLGVSFTKDGNYLYFTRVENTKGMLYRLALPGGPPVKIKEDVDSPISFSPQQDKFAFVRLEKSSLSYLLMISTIDGSSEQLLATRKDGDAFSVYGPAWSPDGEMIVCPVRSWTNGYNVSLIGVDVKSRSEKPLSDHPWFAILQVAWQDDMSGLVMSAKDQPTAPVRLWRVAYPGGALQQITPDLAEYRGVSLAGNDIVTVRSEWTWELVVVSAEKDFANPSTIASGVGLNYGVTWAGNERILFSAMAQDSLNIYRIDADGSNQVQLTAKSKDNYYSPAATSDGQFVVFSSNRTGKYNIWRMKVEDGSDLKQLTFTDSNFYPAVSPDKHWVAYDKQQAKEKSVWKVPLDGGDEIKVADRYRMPSFSPDGQFIAARYDLISGTNDTVLLNASTGELWKRIETPNLDWQRVYWPSQTLSYVEKINGYPNIVSYDIVIGEKKQLTNFFRNQIFSYAWSPDSKLLACQLGSKSSNVVTIRNEK